MLFNRDAVKRRFGISMIKAESKGGGEGVGRQRGGCVSCVFTVYALRTMFDRIAILCDPFPW